MYMASFHDLLGIIDENSENMTNGCYISLTDTLQRWYNETNGNFSTDYREMYNSLKSEYELFRDRLNSYRKVIMTDGEVSVSFSGGPTMIYEEGEEAMHIEHDGNRDLITNYPPKLRIWLFEVNDEAMELMIKSLFSDKFPKVNGKPDGIVRKVYIGSSYSERVVHLINRQIQIELPDSITICFRHYKGGISYNDGKPHGYTYKFKLLRTPNIFPTSTLEVRNSFLVWLSPHYEFVGIEEHYYQPLPDVYLNSNDAFFLNDIDMDLYEPVAVLHRVGGSALKKYKIDDQGRKLLVKSEYWYRGKRVDWRPEQSIRLRKRLRL